MLSNSVPILKFGLIAITVVALACTAVEPVLSPTVVPSATPGRIASPTSEPTSTSTSTPTLTVTPTAVETSTPTTTPRPTDTPTRRPTPTGTPFEVPEGPGPLPTAISVDSPDTPDPSTVPPESTPIPTPVPLVRQPPDVVNIVLMGSDTLSESGWRTDSLIVVSVDPALPSVSLLSIPRDLYVYIPGWKMSRINTADSHGQRAGYPGGGAGLVKATLEYNLGIRVHYFARVDFEGFVKLIDTLGGIDLVVDCELHDTFPDPEAEGGQVDIDLEPGVHHLDGQFALWYARSRWNTNDYDRGRRQQRVLRGMWAKIKQLGVLTRLPALWDDLTQTVQTDLSLENVLWLASVAGRLDTATAIKSRFIDGTVLQSWLTPEGAQVLLPDYGRVGPLVAEALAPPDTGRARQGVARVEVLNGTGWPDWGILVADRLLWEGFEVRQVGQADRADYPQTLIEDLTETDKGSPVWRLARILNVHGENVLPAENPDPEIDFRVIVGQDYRPCYKTYWYQVHAPPVTPTPTPTAAP